MHTQERNRTFARDFLKVFSVVMSFGVIGVLVLRWLDQNYDGWWNDEN